jgi:hypothetical protein
VGDAAVSDAGLEARVGVGTTCGVGELAWHAAAASATPTSAMAQVRRGVVTIGLTAQAHPELPKHCRRD